MYLFEAFCAAGQNADVVVLLPKRHHRTIVCCRSELLKLVWFVSYNAEGFAYPIFKYLKKEWVGRPHLAKKKQMLVIYIFIFMKY